MTVLTISDAARELGWGRRSLQIFLRDNPTDKSGMPFYYPNGNRKLFTLRDIERIRAFLREEERSRLSKKRARVSRRTSTASAPISGDAFTRALELLGPRLERELSRRQADSRRSTLLPPPLKRET